MKIKRYNTIPLEIGMTIGNYEIVGKIYDEKIQGYLFVVRCLLCGNEKPMQRANIRNSTGCKHGCRQCFLNQCKKNKKEVK